jgi:hypothetical protein
MSRGRPGPAVAALACTCVVVAAAFASPRGAASPARTSPPRFILAADSAAPATVVCHDVRTGTDVSYFARSLTLAGELDPTATPLAQCLASVEGLQLRAVRDTSSGEITVVWTDSRRGEPDIFAKRFTATGDTATGWSGDGIEVCSAPHSQYQVDACDDGAGGVFVAWVDYRSGVDADIYLQHLGADGSASPDWPVGGVAVCGAPGEQSSPRLASDGEGGAYVLWLDRRSGNLDLYGQRGGSSGPASWEWLADGSALVVGDPQTTAFSLLPTGEHEVIAVWREESPGSTQLRGLKVGLAGTPEAGWPSTGAAITTSAGLVSDPVAISDGADGALVFWADPASSLRAQRLTALGSIAWSEGDAVLCAGPVAFQAPAVQPDGAGGALLAWQDVRDSTGSKIRALRIDALGSVPSGWTGEGIEITEATGDYFRPSISALSADSISAVTVTWSAEASSPEAVLLRLRSAAARGPALLEVKALPQVVRLTWSWAGNRANPYRIYRRSAADDWAPLGDLQVRDEQLWFEDRQVSEGTFEYCLSLLQGGNEMFFQPIEVIVPAAPRELALSRSRYISAQRSILALVALPTAQPATLALFDVSGRRVAQMDVGTLGVGEHDVELPVHRAASSIYFLRLMQGGVARTTKLALIR